MKPSKLALLSGSGLTATWRSGRTAMSLANFPPPHVVINENQGRIEAPGPRKFGGRQGSVVLNHRKGLSVAAACGRDRALLRWAASCYPVPPRAPAAARGIGDADP